MPDGSWGAHWGDLPGGGGPRCATVAPRPASCGPTCRLAPRSLSATQVGTGSPPPRGRPSLLAGAASPGAWGPGPRAACRPRCARTASRTTSETVACVAVASCLSAPTSSSEKRMVTRSVSVAGPRSTAPSLLTRAARRCPRPRRCPYRRGAGRSGPAAAPRPGSRRAGCPRRARCRGRWPASWPCPRRRRSWR